MIEKDLLRTTRVSNPEHRVMFHIWIDSDHKAFSYVFPTVPGSESFPEGRPQPALKRSTNCARLRSRTRARLNRRAQDEHEASEARAAGGRGRGQVIPRDALRLQPLQGLLGEHDRVSRINMSYMRPS